MNPCAAGPDDVDARRTAGSSTTRRATAQGFVGRACIHPAQVAVVHEVVTPTREEAERAHAMVELFERAEAAGSSVVVDDSGRLVDPATVRAARRTLAMVRDPVDDPAG